jgi:glyoxalase family protein
VPEPIAGLHHVTAVSGDPQGTVDFYRDVLGLRLVKLTVNFDDTSTYHLYLGDETGEPGTSLTFFPFGGRPGRPGERQATATAFAVPRGSLPWWEDHLAGAGVTVDGPRMERFDDTVVRFRDPDGLPLELVEAESEVDPWTGGPVPAEHAVRGFHGVTLTPTDATATGSVLETMGFERTGENGDRIRYSGRSDHAAVVELITGEADRGRPGPGTVHHVAFRTPDEASQDAWQTELREAGLGVTAARDRHYFRSIYVREPGGVLFELATEGPGVTRDEDADDLGSDLCLPPWLEEDRDSIETALPTISLEGIGEPD